MSHILGNERANVQKIHPVVKISEQKKVPELKMKLQTKRFKSKQSFKLLDLEEKRITRTIVLF